MKKLLKYSILLVAGLALFVIAGVFVLFAVIDPNRYRPAIEQAFAAQTGFQLQIAGDISWRFRPVFGLSIADVRLSNGVTPQELASFSSINLRLRPAGLLGGNLDMMELSAENLHVNWYVDVDGQANWLVNAPPATAPADHTEFPVTINIEQINISNASLAIQDLQRGINSQLQNLNLRSTNANLDGRAFPLALSMRLLDYTESRDLTLNLDTNAAVNFNAGDIDLRDLRLNISPVVLTGEFNMQNFQNAPTWQTSLNSNTFNLSHLLEHFTDIPEASMPPADRQQFAIQQLTATGDNNGASIRQLEMTFDDALISASGDVLFPTDNRVALLAYEIRSSALDLDTLFPSADETGFLQLNEAQLDEAQLAEAQLDDEPIASADDNELPIELLRNINVRGNHYIESLTIGGLNFTPVAINLLLQDGLLNVNNTQSIGFYGGELTADLTLDARQPDAQITLETTLSNVSATALTADMPRLGFFTGRFDLSSNHRLTGNTLNTLRDSVSGATQLQVSNSSVNIALLKRVFSAISVLSPTGDMTTQWPDEVRFNEAEALLLFNAGIHENQELSIRMDNFDIAGTGGVDVDAGRFDYRVNFTILGDPAPQTIRVNPNYQNVAWPVRCNADFDDAALQYCSPDLQRVREVFAQIARDEIQRRASDAVTEQVDRLRDRVRNLLQN